MKGEMMSEGVEVMESAADLSTEPKYIKKNPLKSDSGLPKAPKGVVKT